MEAIFLISSIALIIFAIGVVPRKAIKRTEQAETPNIWADLVSLDLQHGKSFYEAIINIDNRSNEPIDFESISIKGRSENLIFDDKETKIQDGYGGSRWPTPIPIEKGKNLIRFPYRVDKHTTRNIHLGMHLFENNLKYPNLVFNWTERHRKNKRRRLTVPLRIIS